MALWQRGIKVTNQLAYYITLNTRLYMLVREAIKVLEATEFTIRFSIELKIELTMELTLKSRLELTIELTIYM